MSLNIIAEPKYKYGQQEQVTVRNHNRSTALERSVLKYWGVKDEGSDQKSDILPHWMAAHARLKNEFTEDEKYHNLMRWLIYLIHLTLDTTDQT